MNYKKVDLVYTQTSANIPVDQSIPNLVKIYVTIRSWMSSIMDLMVPEQSESSAFELDKLLHLTLLTL